MLFLKVFVVYADSEMHEFIIENQPIQSIEDMIEEEGGGRPIENIWFVVSDGMNEKIFDYRR